MTALQMIQNLLEKSQDTYMDHFARLGVMSHVADLSGPIQQQVTEETEQKEKEEKKVTYHPRCLEIVE